MCYFGFQSDTKNSLFHEVFSQNSFKSLTEKKKEKSERPNTTADHVSYSFKGNLITMQNYVLGTS